MILSARSDWLHFTQLSMWEKGMNAPCLLNHLWLAAILRTPPEFLYQELYNEIRKEAQNLKLKYKIFESYE